MMISASRNEKKTLPFSNSSRIRSLKLSKYPFSHALPGRTSHRDVPKGVIQAQCMRSWRRQAVFTPPRGVNQRSATGPQPCGSHIDRIDVSVRSCRRPNVPRQYAPVAIAVVWIDAGPRRDKHDVRKPSSDNVLDRCKHADARGSEVSLCGLRRDQFVQCQVRYRPTQALVLLL